MNCVVICCDTFRQDMLGHPVVRTPHLDRLVREGIVWTNAFAEGLPTIQARRSLFTGRRSFPWRFPMGSRGLWPGIPGWHRIPDDQTTLAELLWEQGVTTGFVSDTYHMFKATQNFVRGFCSWSFIRGQESDNVRSGPLDAVDPSPHLPDGVESHGHLTQYLLNMLERKTEEDYLPARVFRRACAWLEENRANAPWFLWVDSFAPHEYWDPPREFVDAYQKAGQSKDYIAPQVINNQDPSEEEIARTRALYYGYVTFVDKWIGCLLQKLEEMDLLDDTAVLFTSDHGTELWDKGRFGKGPDRLHAYNTRVPLVLRPAGGARGRQERDDLSQHIDVFPTLAGLLGQGKQPEVAEVDGRDLFAKDQTAPERIIIAWGGRVSVRDARWNLILDSTKPDEPGQLYDLKADPEESNDLYDQQPETVRALRGYLEERLGPLPYEMAHQGDSRQCPPNVYRARAAGARQC